MKRCVTISSIWGMTACSRFSRSRKGRSRRATATPSARCSIAPLSSRRHGFRIYDSDTHVLPSAEVLERYVDPDFRPRLAELAPYRVPIRQSAEHSGGGHNYRVATQYYRRVLGEAAPQDARSGRETQWRGSQLPRPGVQDDNAANRVADMDEEGADVHFLIPSSWVSVVGLDDASLEVG